MIVTIGACCHTVLDDPAEAVVTIGHGPGCRRNLRHGARGEDLPRLPEIYTRGDPTEKLDAMESIVPPHLRRGRAPTVRQADRAPQACFVMVSRIGGDPRKSATTS